MLLPNIFTDVPDSCPRVGVLHVGAHCCEERPLYAAVGMDDTRVVWVDANPALQMNQPGLQYWIAAVSDVDGQPATLHITNNMQSSSLLTLKTHLIQHPEVREISQIPVVTTTIDTLLATHNKDPPAFDFLNLDIQGVELQALRGATSLLPHLRAIYTEVNVQELYTGCSQLHEIDAFLAGHNFYRSSTMLTRHGWGDALYLKKTC